MKEEALEESTGDKAGHYYRVVTWAWIALGSDACAVVVGWGSQKAKPKGRKSTLNYFLLKKKITIFKSYKVIVKRLSNKEI